MEKSRYIFSSAADIFEFGKFKGKTLADVLFCSQGYLLWLSQNLPPSFCTFTEQAIKELLLLRPEFDSDTILSELKYEDYIYDLEEDALECLQDDYEDCNDYDYEDRHFGLYAGTYAQDVEGYSDEEINTIFDGEPDAYWNID